MYSRWVVIKEKESIEKYLLKEDHRKKALEFKSFITTTTLN